MSGDIDNKILRVLKESDNPVTTKDIGTAIGKSWHTIQEHCLKLQIDGKVECFRAGRVNLWSLKK
jgi:Mn-dependent DtxR family transcriptional regulator